MMTMKETAIATNKYDVPRLVSAAVKAANSKSIHGFERCFDIMRFLKSLNLSVEDIHSHSRAIHGLASLKDHENPKILTGVNELYSSWMKTLYFRGRDSPPSSSSNDEAIPFNLKKPVDVVKVCSEFKKRGNIELLRLKKNGHERYSQPLISSEAKRFDATRSLQTQRQIPVMFLKSVKDSTCKSIPTNSRLTHETGEKKPNLTKPESFTTKSNQIKKQSVLSKKLSLPHQANEIKKNLIKKKPHVKVSQNPPRCCLALEKKKNTREMLELFEIAKKSADVANIKGILLAKEETSICVDTLSLLIRYPISSTAIETRRIMMKLENLTNHKDRKICKSAASLLDYWRQSIRDQQHKMKLNATKEGDLE